MKLSFLQKYILKECFANNNFNVHKSTLKSFYHNKKIKPKNIIHDITRSIDNLIVKDLIVGFGKKTSHKWYIQKIQLTAKGRKASRDLIGKQQKLPLT